MTLNLSRPNFRLKLEHYCNLVPMCQSRNGIAVQRRIGHRCQTSSVISSPLKKRKGKSFHWLITNITDMFGIPEVSPSCRLSSQKNTLLLRGCLFITESYVSFFRFVLQNSLKEISRNNHLILKEFDDNCSYFCLLHADFGMLANHSRSRL